MNRIFKRSFKPFTKNISQIVITSFFIILMMIAVIGTSSFIGMEQLEKMNRLSDTSYKILMQMNRIGESVNRTEDGIREHFSGDGWKSYVDKSTWASAVFKMENQELDVLISSVGSFFWSVEVMQGPFTLDQSKHYILTFSAKSTTNRPIQAILENSIDYYKYNTATFNLTNQMKRYTIEFRMMEPQDTQAHIVFALGQAPGIHSLDIHGVTIDSVSLTEEETGKELLHNGNFVSENVQSILTGSEREIQLSLHSAEGHILSDSFQEKALMNQLKTLLGQWQQEKLKMIKELNLSMSFSGNLNADSDLQSFELKNETRLEINQLINQITNVEEKRLANKQREMSLVKQIVYGTLIFIVLSSFILALMIYHYFDKLIIRPIRWASNRLMQVAEEDYSIKKEPVIKEEQIHLAITEIRQLYNHINHYSNLLNHQIQIDGLTGLTNRATFDQVIQEWIERRFLFSLVMIDIDHFKNVNDTYGHPAGDEVIKQLAHRLIMLENDNILCFRYGGEEFGILIREANENEAYMIAENLRNDVAGTPSPIGSPVTISIGISEYQKDESTPSIIIERADSALYQSKQKGRNCTTVFH